MSSPQKELGHVQIATGKPENDVLSALASAQLTGVEYQIVLYVIRKTWGFNQKNGWIASQQFIDFTGRSEEGVHKAIRSLREKNILHIERVENKPTIYCFNKDFTSWKGVYYSSGVNKSGGVNKSTVGGVRQYKKGANASTPTKETISKETFINQSPSVAKVFIFSPQSLMPDFVSPVESSPDGDTPADKPKKKKQPFNYEDYSELTRLMKKTCGFTTLENGKTPQDNYARHILLKLLKILTKEHGWPEQEAIDQIRLNMDEFCRLVQSAREADKFLWKTLTTLKNIYFRIPDIYEVTKKQTPKPSTSHLSL